MLFVDSAARKSINDTLTKTGKSCGLYRVCIFASPPFPLRPCVFPNASAKHWGRKAGCHHPVQVTPHTPLNNSNFRSLGPLSTNLFCLLPPPKMLKCSGVSWRGQGYVVPYTTVRACGVARTVVEKSDVAPQCARGSVLSGERFSRNRESVSVRWFFLVQ